MIVDNGKWLNNKCFRDKPEVNDKKKKKHPDPYLCICWKSIYCQYTLYHDLCSFSQTWTFEIRNINDFYMDINT